MSLDRCTAVALVAVLISACTGCTDDQQTRPPVANAAPSSTGDAAAASVTPTAQVRLTPPAATRDELIRVVYFHKDGVPHRDTTVRRTARAQVQYQFRAVCAAPVPTRTVKFDIRTAEARRPPRWIASGDISCDGTETVNGLSTLPAVPLDIQLGGGPNGLSDVTSAYAIITAQS